jgi:transposase-like protein
LNGSGVRSTGRILGINRNTVVSELKKTCAERSRSNAKREPIRY